MDAAAADGVRDVLLQAGTNDIGAGSGSGAVTDGLERVADRARGAGLRVLLSTIPPSTTGERGTPAGREVRDAVKRLYPAGACAGGRRRRPGRGRNRPGGSGTVACRPGLGGLHPFPAGYRSLAAAVDPTALSGSPCVAVGSAR